jgi:hypothetical protein
MADPFVLVTSVAAGLEVKRSLPRPPRSLNGTFVWTASDPRSLRSRRGFPATGHPQATPTGVLTFSLPGLDGGRCTEAGAGALALLSSRNRSVHICPAPWPSLAPASFGNRQFGKLKGASGAATKLLCLHLFAWSASSSAWSLLIRPGSTDP